MSEKRKVRIFHIEDNESFGDLLPLVLGDEYEVLRAVSAANARDLLAKGIGEIDLVVSDNELGDGQGQEVVDEMRNMGFAIPIIGLASGDTSWADASFRKSKFNTEEFRTKVLQLLAGPDSE